MRRIKSARSKLMIACFTAFVVATASGLPIHPQTALATSSTGPVEIGVRESVNGSMLPYVSRSSGMQMVVRQQFATLLHLGANLQVEPELVNKWWFTNGGKTLYMQLNPKAVWSDGTPITSSDVALGINFLASPIYNHDLYGNQGYRVLPIVGAQQVLAGQANSVSGFHIVSASEFYMQLTQPDPSVIANDIQGLMPLPSEILGYLPMNEWAKSSFATNPSIGSGPFLVTNRPPGSVILAANSQFILGAPSIAELQFKVVPPTVARGLLASGQLDLYADAPISRSGQLVGLHGSSLQSVPGSAMEVLAWNDQTAGPSYRSFRQAIEYAINRSALVSSVLAGQATVQNGPLPADSVWSDAKLVHAYGYAPQQARNLLIASGFHIGGKDWLVLPNGAPLNVTINYGTGDPFGQKMAQAIVADLQAIAINARIRGPLNKRQLITEMSQPNAATKSTDIGAYLVGWTVGADPDPRGIWGSQDAFNQYLFQWDNIADPRVARSDQLIAEQVSAQAEVPAYRQTVLTQWQDLISQEVPVDFLFSYNRLSVTSARLKSVVMSGLMGPIDSWKWQVK